MKVLVTGAAGFIGFHLVKKLIEDGHSVVGIDNINDYYSVDLKMDRLRECGIEIAGHTDGNSYQSTNSSYIFCKLDLTDMEELAQLFEVHRFDYVVNLAAQAGIRYSMENPRSYIRSNVEGFFNVLECCRIFPPKKLVYASSSSVYGLNTEQPFAVEQKSETPINVYAASKKTNELMAHAYSHLYNFTTIGLRFFTVYGPWGRPDMAPFLFADAITQGKPITVYNNGLMKRDFTFIDDIIDGMVSVLNTDHTTKYQVFNIGNGKPVDLMHFITCLEKAFGKEAIKNFREMAPGDIQSTWADTETLKSATGYVPKIDIEEGVGIFARWFEAYNRIGNIAHAE
ncbi:NAD-dependent epimerase/dehydratase family protein [Dyadobacter aurulentus]|uniref:NAD-dependent epimerase/dehydratase family protein n=1 Tax=Dyadobacter sp. UC 10 TaxID=2605428 RepID=UPI0011F11F76|nr:NAD-dependent epimerase/dehydratase family protein [Dyadobacter sp. UC 10]KAA0991299.1 NAD-dependent epimerase/dehydratase family protein [Dyadobacter sp. UC 10]